MKQREQVILSSNNKGLGLIEVIMSLSILTIAIMAVLGLRVSFIKSSSEIYSDIDYLQLVKEFSTIVNNKKHCSASLYGLTFRASETKDVDSGLQLTELWFGGTLNGDPLKLTKKLEVEKKYGKITITQISVYLPNHDGGDDLEPFLNLSYESETPIPAEIALNGEYNTTNGETKKIPTIKHPIYLIVSPIPPDTGIKYCVSLGDF